MIDALVIFEDNNSHPFGHWLKPGFRHVWCLVLDDRQHSWVEHNLRLNGYTTSAYCAADYPVIPHLQEQGFTVVPMLRQQGRVAGLTFLNNCVGLTKMVCNIQSFALTPWQLHQHLTALPQQEAPVCPVSSTI